MLTIFDEVVALVAPELGVGFFGDGGFGEQDEDVG
jgi:hypothetical protein